MKFKTSLAAAAVLAAGGLISYADVNSVLAQWNVITSGDLSQVTDIGGNAYIGGNVGDQNSFTTAAVGSSAIPGSEVSFAVAGNIASGNPVNVNGGSVVVGGAIEGGRIINLNGGSGATKTQNDPSGLPASPVSAVAGASQYWSTQVANSTVTQLGNGQLSFNRGGGNSLSVFNVNASLFSSSTYNGNNVQGYTLGGSGTGDILININGNLSGVANNFLSSFSSLGGHILLNFYNATSVMLNGAIYGYVVAPDATVTENNAIQGGVMAQTLNLNGQVELASGAVGATAWQGTELPNIVVIPEASTTIPGLSALVVMAGFLRQKKNLSGSARPAC